MTVISVRYKGSSKSGNYNHAGRPGKVGGSAPSNAYKPMTVDELTMPFEKAESILDDLIVNNPLSTVNIIKVDDPTFSMKVTAKVAKTLMTWERDQTPSYRIQFLETQVRKVPLPDREEAPLIKARYDNPLDMPSNELDGNVMKALSGSSYEDMYLKAMYKDQGFDGKPDLVTSADLDAYIQHGDIELFRGLGGKKAGDFAEQFKTGDYFAGKGMSGNGTYTARSYSAASSYASEGGVVMRMALRKEARIASMGDITGVQMDLESTSGINSYMIRDLGRVATAAGYDAIRISESGNIILVLNRTALRVQIDNVDRGDYE